MILLHLLLTNLISLANSPTQPQTLGEIRIQIEATQKKARKVRLKEILKSLVLVQENLSENDAELAGNLELVRLYIEPISDLLDQPLTAKTCQSVRGEIQALAGSNRDDQGVPPEETRESLKIVDLFCLGQ